MLSHTGTLWHYLGSFTLYTLLAIGMIYGAYWYTRRHLGKPAVTAAPVEESEEVPLAIESSLPLEPQKTLYVIRSGNERFLLSSTGENLQFMSALESVPTLPEPMPEPMPMEEPAIEDAPWFSKTDAPKPVATTPPPSFGSRFIQSVQWLVTSRSGKR